MIAYSDFVDSAHVALTEWESEMFAISLTQCTGVVANEWASKEQVTMGYGSTRTYRTTILPNRHATKEDALSFARAKRIGNRDRMGRPLDYKIVAV